MEKKLHCGDLFKRVLSLAMALVMLLSFAPVPHAHAAEGDVNIRIHFYSEPAWGWTPAIQFWGGSNTDASDYESGPTEITGWGGAQGYVLKDEGDGWYTIVLTGDFEGFQFLDMANPVNNTAGKGYDANMAQFTGTEPTDLYCKYNETTGYNPAWYTDKECTTELRAAGEAETCDVTLHVQNTQNWETVNLYTWNLAGESAAWPGEAMSENAQNAGWFDKTVTLNVGTKAGAVANNGTNQTVDVDIPEAEEVWVVIGEATDGKHTVTTSTTAPGEWKEPPTTCEVTLHVQNTQNWAVVNAHIWNTADSNTSWPGVAMAANPKNTGWFDKTVTLNVGTEAGAVINNGNGTQTLDVTIPEVEEAWIVIGEANDAGKHTVTVSTTAPEGWEIVPKTYQVTVHVQNTQNWNPIKAHIWNSFDSNTTWPGVALEANAFNDGWFDKTITVAEGTTSGAVIHNDNGTQTADVTIPEAAEAWIVIGDAVDGKHTVATSTTAPEGWLTEAPATTYQVTLHVQNTQNWEKVNAHLWGTTDSNTEWPGVAMTANPSNEGWVDKTMTVAIGTKAGTVINNGNGTQTVDVEIPEAEEVWVVVGEAVDGKHTVTTSTTAPEGWVDECVVTIHFLKPEGWGDKVNAYTWGGVDMGGWPGKAVNENADHAGWYDLVAVTEEPTAFNFIFNDGSNQTGDLATGPITGSTELWVVGTKPTDVKTEEPDEWKGIFNYTADIHFHNTADWEIVNVKFGQGDSWNPIEGYEAYKNNEFGVAMEENPHNSGWHTVSVTVKGSDAAINGLFNNGSWGDGNQTGDWSTGTLTGKQEFWYDNGVFSTTRPSGWFDPNRTVFVAGTFPGNNWSPSKDQMTYNAELGLYVFTYEDVPAANYEFKITINGAWDPENYGAGGALKGANIPVAVPETMDVTVYYNDKTHLAVTNVTYKFLDINLSGTGIPEGTKMTDKGLSGIYQAKVTLAPGTYADIKMSIVDGAENTFNAFELKEEKDVTFFYDPASGFYYCDAIPSEIDETKVYFDSQNVKYKAPFGSPATGEEVTFSIDTGAEVRQVSLVITGKEQKTVELTTDPVAQAEADGTSIITWTGKVALNTMGEYDYYFILTDGNGIVVYGDDDGYYGKGQVTDLSSVMPYDLVVHKADFKTPDWMKNAVIYQIFPDRFFDGDESNNQAQTWARGTVDYEYITDWYTLPENPEQKALLDEATYKSTGAHWGDGEWSNEIYGGDLKGITERIDYLKALGVNVIYLNPVFWSISNHRYDAVDYTEIDPILGTLGDFEKLVAVAEANDMHIILDGVFNHVSDDSVYFDRYYKFLPDAAEKFDGKIGAYPYWAYVYDYMEEKGADQGEAETAAKAYFTAEYGITDYSYTEWFQVSSKTMTTADTIGLRAGKPVYSYEGWWGYDSMPIIYATNGSEYQTGNWAEEIINDPNGTDSVTEYWITKGNNGWRLDVANEVSDETWQQFRASVKALDSDAVIIGEIWDDATKYLMGDMYDSVMNYQFRSAVTNFAMGTNAETTTKTMEKIRERYPEEAFYAMMNLVGSHDTTRILSYLDNIPDDRDDKSMAAAFPTYATTSDVAKQRQYLVSFLQFTYAGAPTIYYGDEIGMVGADDPDDRRAFEWGKGNKELVEWYAKLAAIREAYPALRTGSVQPIDTKNTNVMGYVRADDTNTLTVLANNAVSDQTVTLEGTYVDLISGETFDGTVPALNGVILVAEDEVKEVTVNTADLAPAYDPAYIVAERSETPHSHTYDQMVVADKYLASEADCENAATYYYSCACGEADPEEKTFSSGNPLDHDWDDGEITTPATCVEEGVKTFTCKRDANHTKTEDVEIDPDNHDLCEGETTEGTCVTEGTITYHCEREGCDYEKTDKTGLNEDNHEGETVIKNKSETYSGDIHCGSCDELLEEGKVIAVPSTPIKPAKPNWKNWLDKIFGNWWGNKDETPEEPSEPETEPTEPETEPTEPEETEPEETVPSKPITPVKPNWSGIIKKIFGWWKK